jgi:hypothetical protein
MYFAAADPQRHASILIDNRDFDTRRVVRG